MTGAGNMDMLHIAGFAVTVAALAVVLRQYKKEYALLLSLAGGVLLFLLVLSQASPVFEQMRTLAEQAGIDGGYVSVLIKSLGVCFVTQLASDTCRDAGETAVAGKVEMCGKFAVLLLALPLFKEIASLALGLIAGTD